MISVIIPAYNREDTVVRAIDSVLRQTHRDLEVIVVDDGSEDRTRQRVEGIRDPRLVYFRSEKNLGAAAARNLGISLAKGAYIAFQDSDDEWYENKLEVQLAYLEKTGADIVSCAFRRMDAVGQEPPMRIPGEDRFSGRVCFSDLLPANFCSTQTLLMKRACLAEDRFDPAYRRLMDWELLLRLSRKWALYFDNTVLVDQYVQKNSISRDQGAYIDAMNGLFAVLSEEYKAEAQRLSDASRQNRALTESLEEAHRTLEEAEREREELRGRCLAQEHRLDEVWAAYREISNAFFWRLTAPARKLTDAAKRLLRGSAAPHAARTPLRAHGDAGLIGKGIRSLREKGVRATWERVKRKHRADGDHRSAAARARLTKKEREAQRHTPFDREIKFSLLVPLYNTNPKFLREMIRSVQAQTYACWELCMADGSDESHKAVGRIVRACARRDPRLRYQKLAANLGISGNTNACLSMASGAYIALLDHDDLLHPAALYEVMRAICEQNADFVYTDENTFRHKPKDAYCPHFKPDYAPDTLRANNYICHFTVFSRALSEAVGGFDSACDGSQDYDMVLRLTERARQIVHIPKILYFWRAHARSVADSVGAKPYVIRAAHLAVEKHLSRVGLPGEVLDTAVPSMYRIRYALRGTPLVSIVIPNKDEAATLKKCIDSILDRSTYPSYEILIIENNSTEASVFAYYRELERRENTRVLTWHGRFNYSAINNFGVSHARGDYVLLLNNDTEVITPGWIEELLMFAQRADVGAVGAKLYFPDDTVQHAGLGLGLLTLAGHLHKGFDRAHPGYMGRLIYAQDLSGVTGACVMLRRAVWDRVNGLDESFAVAFNDVDLCMRVRQAGYLIVFTPFAELYHYESKSRGPEDTPEKQKRFAGEVRRFQQRWAKELAAGDPYYNPNLTLDREDFSLR